MLHNQYHGNSKMLSFVTVYVTVFNIIRMLEKKKSQQTMIESCIVNLGKIYLGKIYLGKI